MLAAAPIAKMAPSIAAATGTETGRLVDSGEVKRSMIRPRVNGTDKDTADDTASYNAGKEMDYFQQDRHVDRGKDSPSLALCRVSVSLALRVIKAAVPLLARRLWVI